MLVDEGCPSAMPASPEQPKVNVRELEHAYKSLRLLIFGRGKPGNTKEKLKAFDDEKGTKKQHLEFLNFWSQLDPDMLGEAKFSDFQSLLNRLECEAHVHRPQSQKITSRFNNRETGHVMMDDLIDAIWPDLGPEETAKVWQHMEEELEKRRRVAVDEPPVLPHEDREALERVFNELDVEKTGYLSFEMLAAARDDCELPIMDPDRLNHYAAEWDIWWGPLGSDDAEDPEQLDSFERRNSRDRSGSGDRRHSVVAASKVISLKSFLLMTCPAGFRAFDSAKVTTQNTGGVLIRSNSGTWHAL
jgi:Ca2+-binding EF-hand superfamily protein